MTNDRPAEDADQDVAELLSACDEAMATGEMPSSILILDSPDGDQSELEKDLGCMNLLRVALQQRESVSVEGSPSADLPATRDISVNKSTHISPRSPFKLPKKIGRFEILSVLGSGGYGIVYLARDPMLLREVAIKAPRAEVMLQPNLKDRFLAEGRMAASLDHPNICPVYEAAESDGICYIASAYCPGVNLAKWMSQRTEPVPFHTAATIAMQLADGVEHAHSRGIIHRDLKPGNVLFTPISAADTEKMLRTISQASDSAMRARHEGVFDLGFIPKITDFGLAKAEMAETGHTISGTVAGTPEYMSPEQADGKTNTAGRATDVYSLGAILYELITGTPPFRAETALMTLHQVIHELPVTPIKLRAKLPADLETICLKCLHKEPKQRYATAGELADDLTKFLNHEPIKARPLSLLGQLTAWRRRKPVIARLTAALVMVGIVGFAGVFWQWRRAEAFNVVAANERDNAWIERNRAIDAQNRAEQAQQRAEANFQRGKAVLDKLTVLGNQFLNQPGMDSAARAVLEQTAIFYKGFLEDTSKDPKVRLAAADSINQAARIHSSIDQDLQSQELHRQATELYQGLVTEFPDNIGYRLRLIVCMRDLARALRRLDREKESEETYDRTIKIGRESLTRFPKSPQVKNMLANVLLNRASGQISNDRDANAPVILREASELQKENVAAYPKIALYQTEVALVSEAFSRYYLRHGDFQRAAEEAKNSVTIWKIVDEKKERTVGDSAFYLARNITLMSQVHRCNNSFDDAVASAKQAEAIAEKIVAKFPDRITNRYIYSEAMSQLALALMEQKKFAEAKEIFDRAMKFDPTIGATVNDYALFLTTCEQTSFRDPKAAAVLMEPVCKKFSTDHDYWTTLALAHVLAGQLPQARIANERAFKVRKEGSPIAWFALAMIFTAERNVSAALEPWRKGIARLKDSPTPHEDARVRAQLEALLRKEKIHVD